MNGEYFLISGKKNITKIFLLLLIVLLILITLVSCSKTYSIRVYSSGINQYELQEAQETLTLAKLGVASGIEYSEELMAMTEERIRKIENTPDKVDSYRASKIIESSSTSVRFIDKDGKEQFINGKRIEIRENNN